MRSMLPLFSSSSVGWNLSGVKYFGSFTDSHLVNVFGISFNSLGTKMFILLRTSDTSIIQYNLLNPFDITSAVYFQTVLIATANTSIWGLTFNNDGSRFYFYRNDGRNDMEQIDIVPWDITQRSNAVLFDVSLNVGGTLYPMGFLNYQGDKMYTIGYNNVDLQTYLSRWNLSTPFDITSATYLDRKAESSPGVFRTQYCLNPLGTIAIRTIINPSVQLESYDLSTPSDFRTAVAKDSFLLPEIPGQPVLDYLYINKEGKRIFVLGSYYDSTQLSIYQYNI